MARRELHKVLDHLRRVAGAADAGDLSDRQLLHRFARQHDENAFAVLVRRHAALVLGVCQRILCRTQDAEDVFQATFLVLARKAVSTRWRESIANWLHEVAHRLAVKARAEIARRHIHERQAGDMARTETRTEDSLRELCGVLDEELRRLPEHYRQPLLLCYLEGQTRDQAARQLGWSLRTLHRRLECGLKLLRSRLTARGLTLSAALLSAALAQQTASAESSALLLGITVRAATHFAAMGDAGVSAAIVSLAEEGLKSMAMIKAKITLAVLLVGSVMVIGAGTLTHHLLSARQPQTRRETRTPSPKETGNNKSPVEPRVRTDALGDPLPPGAVARMGTLRLYHFGSISNLIFSPDSKTVASSGTFGDVRLWDAATGKELCQVRAYKEMVSGVAFSPDGKLLLLACYWEPTILVWEMSTGKELRRFHGDKEGIDALALSRDGKLLASAGHDGSIRLWETAGWKELRRMTGHKDRIRSLVFAPDGKTLYSTSVDRTLRIWDTDKGRELRALSVGLRNLDDMALSPDGRVLAGRNYGDGIVALWDIAEGKQIGQLQAPHVRGIAFSPDGNTLATAGADDTLRAWDVAAGKELRRVKGFTCSGKVAYAPNGKMLACSTAANAGEVCFRDPATLAEVLDLGGHRDTLAFVSFSSDGKTLRTSDINGVIGFWDAATGKPSSPMRPPPRDLRFSHVLTRTILSPDGKLAAAIDGNNQIHLWRPATGAVIHKIAEPPASWKHSAFSPDGAMLAATHQDGTIRLWDTATGRPTGRFREENTTIKPDFFFPIFTSDGKTLVTAARHDGTIRLWDVKTEREVRRLQAKSKYIRYLALSADGSMLASVSSIPSGGRERVRPVCQLWDLKTGEELHLFGDQQLRFDALAFAPDGKTLATGNYDGVRLWEVATRRERRRFEGHRGTAYCLAFSTDGRLLASGGTDHTAVVWDLTSIPEGDSVPLERQALWAALAGPDAARAYKAMCSLIADRSAMPFLRQRLHSVADPDGTRIARLIADLDSDQFAVRGQATRELEKLGDLVEPALRKRLTEKPSLESLRRVEELLRQLRDPVTDPQLLQALRSIEVLEHIGTPEARRVLETLAKGAPSARLTREAKASRQRLAQQPVSKP
jgi:RNA polymerase sigma factor (sigma-70 family)